MTEFQKRFQQHFIKGFKLFNAGDFFESHEEWELIWHKAPEDERDFFQGLILVAAVFVHLSKGKVGPARKALDKAKERLRPYRKGLYGVEIEEILSNLESLDMHEPRNFRLKVL